MGVASPYRRETHPKRVLPASDGAAAAGSGGAVRAGHLAAEAGHLAAVLRRRPALQALGRLAAVAAGAARAHARGLRQGAGRAAAVLRSGAVLRAHARRQLQAGGPVAALAVLARHLGERASGAVVVVGALAGHLRQRAGGSVAAHALRAAVASAELAAVGLLLRRAGGAGDRDAGDGRAADEARGHERDRQTDPAQQRRRPQAAVRRSCVGVRRRARRRGAVGRLVVGVRRAGLGAGSGVRRRRGAVRRRAERRHVHHAVVAVRRGRLVVRRGVGHRFSCCVGAGAWFSRTSGSAGDRLWPASSRARVRSEAERTLRAAPVLR